MNKIKLAHFFSLLAVVFFLSCENEPIDPTLLLVSPDCHAPYSFDVSDFVGGNTVNLSWDTGDGSSWEVQYGTHGFLLGSGTSVILSNNSSIINGLVSTTDYDFYIRTICGAGVYSQWVGPVGVGESAVSCSEPNNMLVVRSGTDETKATVSWTANPDESSWQIQYGAQGFVIGAGTQITSNTTSKVISNLVATVSYDFYLRSKCSANDYSNWVGPYTIVAGGTPSTTDYWPRAINNQWIFSVDNVNQDPIKIVSTDLVGGNTYYTFEPNATTSNATIRIRKSNTGDYFYKIEDITTGGGVTTGSETIILKDYLPVGGSWTNNYVQTTTYPGFPPINLDVAVVSTIMETNATVTVPDNTFNNVIVVKRIQTFSGVGFPTTVTTSTYWFAKNQGPVKITTQTDGGAVTSQLLTAHILF